jgi:hypothetical protein
VKVGITAICTHGGDYKPILGEFNKGDDRVIQRGKRAKKYFLTRFL